MYCVASKRYGPRASTIAMRVESAKKCDMLSNALGKNMLKAFVVENKEDLDTLHKMRSSSRAKGVNIILAGRGSSAVRIALCQPTTSAEGLLLTRLTCRSRARTLGI